MKKILFSVFAVAALASCVQNETINPGSAIDFGAPFVGNATKAADPSYGEDPAQPLTAFKVYGTVEGTGAGVVNIFNGANVTGSIGNNWECDVTQYWIPGATYNFAAVVNATVTPDDNKMPATLVPVTHTVADDAKHYVVGQLKDLLYAFNDPITAAAENGPVNFAFKHLLAKAQFVVTSNTVDDYYYNVEGIKINNFATGTYTIASKTWSTEVEDAKGYELGDIKNITAESTLNKTEDKFMTNDTQVLLIPTANAFTVEFTVKLYNKNGKTDPNDHVLLREIKYTGSNAMVVEIKENDELVGLKAGYAYNFKLDLTAGSEILFTVTSQPTWTNSDVDLN